MTEQVKFPGTDVEAPIEIYARRSPSDGERMWFADTDSYKWSVIPHSLTYHRGDTVTPNDQVMDMMRQAFNAGIDMSSTLKDKHHKDVEKICLQEIESIRGIYASSDSD